MIAPVRYHRLGHTSADIARGLERQIREGGLRPGDPLPPVRTLAAELGVSPGTVASAYRTLRLRAMTTGDGRRGTRVATGPPSLAWGDGSPAPSDPVVPFGVRDLATGNPDPTLLPDLRPFLRALADEPEPIKRLYGAPAHQPELIDLARAQFTADQIPAERLAVVGGALDGIERVLQVHLRPGDTVAVEDPGYAGLLDLVASLGLSASPLPVDDEGPDPEVLDRILAAGADAVVVTPRAQNPTGAALSEARAVDLRAILARHPESLVVEDDHAGLVAGAPCVTLADRHRARWAVVRSVSKSMGPDLRLAVLAADDLTIARVEGRRQVGAGWVSHVLQSLVVALWSNEAVIAGCQQAADLYRERRVALIEALAGHGLAGHGVSGLNVWLPVPEEQTVVTRMAAAGWAVTAGGRFRRRSGPAIRITTAALPTTEAMEVAAEVARALAPATATRLG